MVFDEPGFLLIRRSLVRAQVEEPKLRTPSAAMLKGFFLWTPHSLDDLASHGAEGLSAQVWMIGKEAIHSSLNEGSQLCCHVAFC